ncbi:site-2 protease family protein [Fimbriiglobus ruber]|nr:site-2 protease family protein [Fimbriiglobus ruber]
MMRDPMRWAVPLPRMFGIPVRIHVTFFLVTLGLFLRQVGREGNYYHPIDVFAFTILLLFGIILIHEFGHCFAGRSVGGEATEILIWPLGGLAMVDTPQNWRAHTITAAGGPLVNLGLCVVTGVVILAAGFFPAINPIYYPYECEMKNYRTGQTFTSGYGLRMYKPGTAEEIMPVHYGKPADMAEDAAKVTVPAERALLPGWLAWVNRAFWMSWVLLLLNMLPAYPLDGGQILQGLIWRRSGYRQGTTIAAYAGFVVALLFFLVSFAVNESFLVFLGFFMILSAWVKLQQLETEDGGYGDFSQGYMSLERDDPPPRPRRQNVLKRWLQARTIRRLQREIEERQREDERMDQLLEKIARDGKDALTDEERRFMSRVSERYRNRS